MSILGCDILGCDFLSVRRIRQKLYVIRYFARLRDPKILFDIKTLLGFYSG